VRHDYGADRSQFGELSRPSTTSRGTVVIIHGGFWRAQYGLALGRGLAADLVARGYTTWNLEYRRVGNGGGWPSTFTDVAAGIDTLAALDVDTDQLMAVGHSAGGHLATWAAGRPGIQDGAVGSDPQVRLAGVVSQAGVLDLVTAALDAVGGTAVPQLLGGMPDAVPARYAIADPFQAIPLEVPVLCVHAKHDLDVPFAQSVAYVAAAQAAGARATLAEAPGDHFTLIDAKSAAWNLTADALPALLRG
jgi:acetyl esterase/lipase